MLRHNSDHPYKNCTIDGCDRPLRSKGRCSTHYNQLSPNRHTKKLVPCAWCGTEVLKSSGGGRVNGSVCSEQCRTWLRFGYSVLPDDHWARWYGKTSTWSPPKPPPTPPFQHEERTCAWCEETFTARRDDAKTCSRRCKGKASYARRRARERNAQGTYTWGEVIRVWRSIDKRCSYCDERVTVIEPDHVIPLSKGGSNSITNVTPSCPLCNSDKRDLLLNDWYTDRARRNLPPRRLNPALTHLTHALLPAA
jgi:hypothetical protein